MSDDILEEIEQKKKKPEEILTQGEIERIKAIKQLELRYDLLNVAEVAKAKSELESKLEEERNEKKIMEDARLYAKKETVSYTEAMLNLEAILQNRKLDPHAGWLWVIEYFRKELDDYQEFLYEKHLILTKDPSVEKFKNLNYYDSVLDFLFKGTAFVDRLSKSEITSIIKEREDVELLRSLDSMFKETFKICESSAGDYKIKTEESGELSGIVLVKEVKEVWGNYINGIVAEKTSELKEAEKKNIDPAYN
jgi:hypothetical protein